MRAESEASILSTIGIDVTVEAAVIDDDGGFGASDDVGVDPEGV